MSDKYEVIRPWHGVKKGQVVRLSRVHPSLKHNVRPISEEVAEAKLEVATPGAPSAPADRKKIIKDRLKKLEIEFDGRASLDDLVLLLPQGELEQLSPAE